MIFPIDLEKSSQTPIDLIPDGCENVRVKNNDVDNLKEEIIKILSELSDLISYIKTKGTQFLIIGGLLETLINTVNITTNFQTDLLNALIQYKKALKAKKFSHIGNRLNYLENIHILFHTLKEIVLSKKPSYDLKEHFPLQYNNRDPITYFTFEIMEALNKDFFTNWRLNKSQFSNEIQEFIKDCARLGAFLTNEIAVTNQLEKMNHRLSLKVEQVQQELNEEFPDIDILASLRLGKTKQYKILRNFLEDELARFGFYPKFGKALGYLSSGQFRKMLRHGIFVKDPGLGELMHGEFTHMLQFLLAAYENEETPFLTHNISYIYKTLGSDEFIHMNKSDVEVNIWNIILDKQFPDPKLNFTSPNYLMKFILTSTDTKFSVLQLLFQSRIKKRSKSELNIEEQELKANTEKYGLLEDTVLYPVYYKRFSHFHSLEANHARQSLFEASSKLLP